jgi:hypothetical protein
MQKTKDYLGKKIKHRGQVTKPVLNKPRKLHIYTQNQYLILEVAEKGTYAIVYDA